MQYGVFTCMKCTCNAAILLAMVTGVEDHEITKLGTKNVFTLGSLDITRGL